ncbi:hypothetical protein DFH06DRAFT_1199372 [Mycena polygramma]|nr:hypothetical protein DFH06DRAFT_1199372 [Mycena polygramma]
MLVFPTKAGGSEERSFAGKKQDQLKDMCRDYGLAVSGNKSQLKLRLQHYSERFCNDPASCNLTPVIRRTHKGPRNGEKKSQPKQSTNRRAAIIDTERVTERSKDTRTVDDVKDLLNWTCVQTSEPETLPTPSVSQPSSQPDRSLHDRMQLIENHLAAIATSGIGQSTAPAQWTQASFAPFTAYAVPPVDYTVYDPTQDCVRQFHDTLFDFSSVTWAQNHNLHIGNQPGSADPLFSTALPQPVPTTCVPCIPSRMLPPVPSNWATTTVITITVDEIKRIMVPATSFAENIERLNQMWDDTSIYWKNDSVVLIGNRPIALLYWPDIFKKSGLWSAHKSNWTEWKVRTPEEFWSVFRGKDGGKMSYTAVCATLRKERKTADQALANQAKQEYGDNFQSTFSYRCSKTNSQVVMSKASSIAKEYKRLHGI